MLEVIRLATAGVTAWNPFNERSASGLLSICRLVSPDESLMGDIAAGISASDIKGGENAKGVAPGVWGAAIVTFLNGLGEPSLSNLNETIRLHADPDSTIEVCSSVVEGASSRELWARVRPENSVPELETALVEAVSGGRFNDEHYRTVQFIVEQSDGSAWTA